MKIQYWQLWKAGWREGLLLLCALAAIRMAMLPLEVLAKMLNTYAADSLNGSSISLIIAALAIIYLPICLGVIGTILRKGTPGYIWQQTLLDRFGRDRSAESDTRKQTVTEKKLSGKPQDAATARQKGHDD